MRKLKRANRVLHLEVSLAVTSNLSGTLITCGYAAHFAPSFKVSQPPAGKYCPDQNDAKKSTDPISPVLFLPSDTLSLPRFSDSYLLKTAGGTESIL